MMVKYFCDKCEGEIAENKEWYKILAFKYRGYTSNPMSRELFLEKTLCEDCYDEVLALIGGDESE